MRWLTQSYYHRNQRAEARRGKRKGDDRVRIFRHRCRPTSGNTLGRAVRQLNDDVGLALVGQASHNRDGLSNQRVVGSDDTDALDLSVIQLRSVLRAV